MKPGGCPRLAVVECPATPLTSAWTTGEKRDHIFLGGGGPLEYGLTDYQAGEESFGFGTFNNGQVVGSSVNARKGFLLAVVSKRLAASSRSRTGCRTPSCSSRWPGRWTITFKAARTNSATFNSPSGVRQGRLRHPGTDPNRRLSTDEEDQSNLTCGMNCENQGVPYSFHSGGCNFLFGDGSVHFLNQNIDMGLLAALGTYQGGEPASLGNY